MAPLDSTPTRKMSPALVALFATGSAVSVANVYFAQPLLDLMAADYGIAAAAVGGVVTATQAGSALALLLLVPLGDRVDRRRLILVQVILLCLALLAVTATSGALALTIVMLAVGLLGTAMTQGLIAYAASAAGPGERGSVVGAAQGGVVIGLLLARVLAGAIADVAGWRWVYGISSVAMAVLGILLWRRLPVQSLAPKPMSYGALIRSMLTLLKTERVLQVRGTLALLMFAAFGIFWSTLVLPLAAPPFSMSHTAIGAFGLVGVAGALAAGRAGRLADRGLGQRTTGAALGLLVLCWLPLGVGMRPGLGGMALLAIGILALDIAVQALQVTNQGMIFAARPAAASRMVGCYMMFYAAGSGLGALAGTAAYAAGGWHAACLLGAGISLAALLFWHLTRGWMQRA